MGSRSLKAPKACTACELRIMSSWARPPVATQLPAKSQGVDDVVDQLYHNLPINLYINSPGGSVTAGLAIYDTMQYIQSPVTTICLGQAASMGSLLLCGGAAGQRYCLPHSRIMVHQVSGGYHGQASDIAIHAKEILRVREQLNMIYKRHLTVERSLEEIAKVMERDFFMGAEEARDWGIVDKVLDRRSQAEAK